MQAKRSRFLTWLILIMGAAISVATMILLFLQNTDRMVGYFPNWFSIYLEISLVSRLVALSAIWNMKRWGVYVFFLFECIEVAMGQFVFTSVLPFLTFPLRFLMGVASLIVVLGIWCLALRNNWQAFT